MRFSQFHKISLLFEIKVHFSAEIKAIRPTEFGSPLPLTRFPFPFTRFPLPLPFSSCFSFGTRVCVCSGFLVSCCLPALFEIVISSYEINMSPPRDISVVASAGCMCMRVCGCHLDRICGAVNAAAAISPGTVSGISPAFYILSPLC